MKGGGRITWVLSADADPQLPIRGPGSQNGFSAFDDQPHVLNAGPRATGATDAMTCAALFGGQASTRSKSSPTAGPVDFSGASRSKISS